MAKDLSVIVVAFDSADSVERCLKSIPSSAGRMEFEIIVVDNNSTDSTLSIVRSLGMAKIIENKANLGFAAACNTGAREATGKDLVFLNPDAFLLGDALQQMSAFEGDLSEGAIVGGLVIDEAGKVTNTLRSFPSLLNQLSEALFLYKLFPKSKTLGAYYYTHISRDTPMDVDAVEGSFFLIPRDVFERLHGFDEHFFLYSEDTDLCYRARQLGVPVKFFPGASAVHAGPEAGSRVSRRYILAMHLAQLKFIRRHFTGFKRAGSEFVKIVGLLIRVPFYLLLALATFRIGTAAKALYTFEAAIRGIFSSEPPETLFK